MTFPTIPTVGAGRVLTGVQANTTATRTFPNLSGLTKNPGDLLIAICVAYQSSTTNAQFGSWTGGFTEFHDSGTSTTMAIGMAYKWSDGTETGTISVTQSATITGHASFILLSIPGAHLSTPPEAGSRASGTTSAADPAAFDPAGWGTEDTLWIAVRGCGETSTTGSFTALSTPPTNYTDSAQTGISGDVVGGVEGGASFRQLNAASENVGPGTCDVSNARNAIVVVAVRPAPPAFNPTVDAFRFYENGTESGSSPVDAEDTNITGRSVDTDSKIHLRVRLREIDGGTAGAATDDYQLQYRKNGGSWTNVTASSNDVRTDTASSLTDSGATTNRATNGISDPGSGSFVAGIQEEGDGQVANYQITAGDFTEHVFALVLRSADLANNDQLEFRVTLNGGDPGITNSVTPSITVAKTIPFLPGGLAARLLATIAAAWIPAPDGYAAAPILQSSVKSLAWYQEAVPVLKKPADLYRHIGQWSPSFAAINVSTSPLGAPPPDNPPVRSRTFNELNKWWDQSYDVTEIIPTGEITQPTLAEYVPPRKLPSSIIERWSPSYTIYDVTTGEIVSIPAVPEFVPFKRLPAHVTSAWYKSPEIVEVRTAGIKQSVGPTYVPPVRHYEPLLARWQVTWNAQKAASSASWNVAAAPSADNPPFRKFVQVANNWWAQQPTPLNVGQGALGTLPTADNPPTRFTLPVHLLTSWQVKWDAQSAKPNASWNFTAPAANNPPFRKPAQLANIWWIQDEPVVLEIQKSGASSSVAVAGGDFVPQRKFQWNIVSEWHAELELHFAVESYQQYPDFVPVKPRSTDAQFWLQWAQTWVSQRAPKLVPPAPAAQVDNPPVKGKRLATQILDRWNHGHIVIVDFSLPTPGVAAPTPIVPYKRAPWQVIAEWQPEVEVTILATRSTSTSVDNPPRKRNNITGIAATWQQSWGAQRAPYTAAWNFTPAVVSNPPPRRLEAPAIAAWAPKYNVVDVRKAGQGQHNPPAAQTDNPPIRRLTAPLGIEAWQLEMLVIDVSPLGPKENEGFPYRRLPDSIIKSWEQKWDSQRLKPTAAWNFVPAQVNQPRPYRRLPDSINLSWQKTWSSQKAAPNASWNVRRDTVLVSRMVPSAQTVEAWRQTWVAQRADLFTPASIDNPPTPNTQNFKRLVARWEVNWDAQTSERSLAWFARVDQPPPYRRYHTLAHINGEWQVIWGSQRKYLPVTELLPVLDGIIFEVPATTRVFEPKGDRVHTVEVSTRIFIPRSKKET